MTLMNTMGHTVVTGEDSEDLRQWLRGQEGCPDIEATVVVSCANPAHGEQHPTWFFVEADPALGLARRRCVACADQTYLLDSEQHWNFPAMFCCESCGQSMVELAAGIHPGSPDEHADPGWVALGCRCVNCGRISGLTDMVVAPLPLEELAAQL